MNGFPDAPDWASAMRFAETAAFVTGKRFKVRRTAGGGYSVKTTGQPHNVRRDHLRLVHGTSGHFALPA